MVAVSKYLYTPQAGAWTYLINCHLKSPLSYVLFLTTKCAMMI